MIEKSFHTYFKNRPDLKKQVLKSLNYYKLTLKEISCFYEKKNSTIVHTKEGEGIATNHGFLMIRLKDDTSLPVADLN